MATARTFSTAKFALTLYCVSCGFLDSIEGGDISADVIVEATASTAPAKKHIGQPKYEPFTVSLGFSMAQAVYDWIAAAWSGSSVPKDGSITAVDSSSNAGAQSQFVDASITEVTMPELDAQSKTVPRIALTFAPEQTTFGKASGKMPAVAGKAKLTTAAMFKLELDALDCSHVRKIDSFTVEVPLAAGDVGEARHTDAAPAPVRFPNLRVTMADGPTAAGWQTWFDDFVIKGSNDASHEKSGAIVYLAPDLKTEIGRVVLHNVGIFALRRHPVSSGSEAVRTLVAELYCERMELHVGKPAPAPPAPPPVEGPVRPLIRPVRPLDIQR